MRLRAQQLGDMLLDQQHGLALLTKAGMTGLAIDGAIAQTWALAGLRALGVPFHIIEQDTYSVVSRVIPEGKTMCSLCSRLRRGSLYSYAEENGFTKIALGHHRDDLVATFFLNLFFHAKLSAMPPKLLNEDGDLMLYRPLSFVAEADCEKFARAMNYPIIPCDLCGSQEGLQRMQVKKLLDEWETRSPGRRQVMFRALMNVRPSHLADPSVFDFAGLMRGSLELSENPPQLKSVD